MRVRLLVASALVVVVVAALAGLGYRRTHQPDQSVVAAMATDAAAVAASPAAEADPSPEDAETAGAAEPESFESPVPATADTATPQPAVTPAASPTIPAEPTGLPADWKLMAVRDGSGHEADLVARTGDINNLGYGWPREFTPFSGKSTPPHEYPCRPRPGSPPGTDRIMLGTSVSADDLRNRRGNSDGYSTCSSRPENLPQAIPIAIGALPSKVRVVLVQLFLDDFQSPIYHSHFQVSLSGTRIPTFEDAIAQLNQTGPIGKLVTLRLLPEYFPLLRTGNVSLYIDDPTSHALDGYAIDFVRVLVNPHAFQYAVTIACTVIDADTQKPISGAACASAQVTETTNAEGKTTLRGVPAGMASVSASAVNYDSSVALLDLPVGTPGVAPFALHRHREKVADLKAQIARSGSVALYGIHFDTASATLRPESITSLQTLLQLIEGDRSSRWIIVGHTDNRGGAAYNLDLSSARARSVVTWLTAHGAGASRLEGQGFGMTRPVADNGTESGRALNRRVEVTPAK